MSECLDYTDIHNTMKYVLAQESKSGSDKQNPYLLLVYGPPGSGKSTQAINFALDDFNLENDYMHISIDSIIDDTCQYNSQLKKKNIKRLMNNRRIIKNKVKYLIKVFSNIAIMRKKNVCVEITGRNFRLNINDLILEFKHYGWKIFIIYPYTPDVNILYARILSRAKYELRFLTYDIVKMFYKTARNNFGYVITNKNIFNGIIIYDTKKVKINDKKIGNNMKYFWFDEKVIKDDSISKYFLKFYDNSISSNEKYFEE